MSFFADTKHVLLSRLTDAIADKTAKLVFIFSREDYAITITDTEINDGATEPHLVMSLLCSPQQV